MQFRINPFAVREHFLLCPNFNVMSFHLFSVFNLLFFAPIFGACFLIFCRCFSIVFCSTFLAVVFFRMPFFVPVFSVVFLHPFFNCFFSVCFLRVFFAPPFLNYFLGYLFVGCFFGGGGFKKFLCNVFFLKEYPDGLHRPDLFKFCIMKNRAQIVILHQRQSNICRPDLFLIVQIRLFPAPCDFQTCRIPLPPRARRAARSSIN